ncbi:regulator of chromosome condensation [Angomonas deanei]|nr:regulator of chromosome condensation [Angomonas deanei]|eukprot:EPY26574.1 regulator of chromosome condensation [Angomonas deanei]
MIGGHDKPLRMGCSHLSSCWLGVRNVLMTMGSGMWGELAVGNPRYCPRVVANEYQMPICLGQVEVQPFWIADGDVIVDVCAGFCFFNALTLKGNVYGWGANNFGQCMNDIKLNSCCGFAQKRTIPGEVVVQLACSNYAVIARTMSGAVYGWGLAMMLGNQEELEENLRNAGFELQEGPKSFMCATEPVEISFFSDVDVALVRGGPWHFAAIAEDGTVYTWGLGNNGRLGHGNMDDVVEPEAVEALENEKVVEVACGSFHTVFVTEDGKAFACGDNQAGQCGVVGEFDVLTPTQLNVTAGRKVVHASCGRHHTLLVLNTSEIVAYGSGIGLGVGIGYGMRMVRCQPVMENYHTFWTESGPQHNFALTIPKVTTMLVVGLPHRGVKAAVTSVGLKEGILSCAIGAGFTLMISRRGSCYSFGLGGWGQLGYDATMTKEQTPEGVPVAPYATRVGYFSHTVVTYVAAGYAFSLCIVEGERVYAWGSNSYGQCGLAIDPKEFGVIGAPREIEWLCDKQIVQVACGSYFALAMSSTGEVYSWGVLECCGIGDKPSKDVLPTNMLMEGLYPDKKESRGSVIAPVKIPTLANIVQVAAGGWHAVALNAIGELYTWGVGKGGRLGLGNETNQYTPVRINHSAFFTRIGCGAYSSYAIDDDAKLYLWGVNEKNRLGTTAKGNVPTAVKENVRDCCMGRDYTMFLSFGGRFYMSGTMEYDSPDGGIDQYTCNGFEDTGNLPPALREDTLRADRFKGVRIFGGEEHVVVLLYKGGPNETHTTDAVASLRRQPEPAIRSNSG